MKRFLSFSLVVAVLVFMQGSVLHAQKYSDIFQMIRGRVPGVTVGPSEGGSMPSIIIRGIGTNSSATQPIFIVDGVQTENIAGIDPDNVDSIEVLKDAGSTAIYGMQGANGVIIITTVGAAQAAKAEAEAKKAEKKAKRAQAAIAALQKKAKDSKLIALSFDDGPNTEISPKVLDVLEKYKARASFFVIGQNINDESKAMMLRAQSLGCTIENHSWTHSHMSRMSKDSVAREVNMTSDKIEEVTGRRPLFFRPPYIDVSPAMHEAVDLIFISGDSSDDWIAETSAEKRAQNVLERCGDDSVILMHDFTGNEKTVQALEILIPELIKRGYQLVSVPELFSLKGVTPSAHNGVVFSRTSDISKVAPRQ